MNPESLAVLLVNGRDPTAQALACFLTIHGMRVTAVADAVAGELEAQSRNYDCLVLYLGLDVDVPVILRRFRAQSNAPIVFIAATNMVAERVEALESGADDCVAMPFSDRELMSRIHASVRRARRFHLLP